jgi:sterol desaturase/sphingolipid hydroxylase (fatty acid hydroxylase superfamily)
MSEFFSEWLPTLQYAAYSFGALLVIFSLLELSSPARKQPLFRREWTTDAIFFAGQYFIWHAVSLSFLFFVNRHLLAPISLAESTAALNPWVLVVLGVGLGDLCVYWFHRACHHYNFLWRFHAVHHSAEHLDWVAAHREHPLDGMFTQLFQNVPALLLGVDFSLVAGFALFRGAWGVFIHSNAKYDVGPLRYLLGAPELHHWHHAKVSQTAHNFANLAPWLDVLFGTYHKPKEPEETYPLGLTDPWPRSYLGQLVYPFFPPHPGLRPTLSIADNGEGQRE